MCAGPGHSRRGKGTKAADTPARAPRTVAFAALLAAFVAAMFMMAAPLSVYAQSATPTRTPVTGCCFCKNCPITVNPFCTDSTGDLACADQCLPLGCEIAFSQSQTCGGGCAGMPPYSSPTPSPTPTATTTDTPTQSPTPTRSGTPTLTP